MLSIEANGEIKIVLDFPFCFGNVNVVNIKNTYEGFFLSDKFPKYIKSVKTSKDLLTRSQY